MIIISGSAKTHLHHKGLIKIALIVTRISGKAEMDGSEAKATAKHVSKLEKLSVSALLRLRYNVRKEGIRLKEQSNQKGTNSETTYIGDEENNVIQSKGFDHKGSNHDAQANDERIQDHQHNHSSLKATFVGTHL